jgi:hypothetical protein
MDLDQRIAVSSDALFQEVEGEAVILDLAQSQYFGLDEVGTRIWQLLQTHGTARAVIDQMLEEFDSSRSASRPTWRRCWRRCWRRWRRAGS